MAVKTPQKVEVATPKKEASKKSTSKAETIKFEESAKKQTPKKDTAKKDTPKKETSKKDVTPSDDEDDDVKPTPAKKKKEPVKYTALTKEVGGLPVPVDITFMGESVQSKAGKPGTFSHTLKLDATAPFELVQTYVANDGVYEGAQVIVLRPAKPFKLMQLPEELRQRIYNFYFAPKGEAISVDTKRKGGGGVVYAKSYAEGSKFRIALLAISQEVHKEATSTFYSQPISVPDTTSVLEFLGSLPNYAKPMLRDLTIKSVQRNPRTAFSFLQEAKYLRKLTLKSWYYHNEEPTKAATVFWSEASKMLEALATVTADKVQRTFIEVKEDPAEPVKSGVKQVEVASDGIVTEMEITKTEQTDTEMAEADAPAAPAANTDGMHPTITTDGDTTFPIVASDLFDGTVTTSAIVKPSKPAPQVIETKGKRSDAIDILHFDDEFFTFKDDEGDKSMYDDEMVEEFKDALKAKLNISNVHTWACVCGSLVRGHVCGEELEKRCKAEIEKKRLDEEFGHLKQGHGGVEMLRAIYAF
ncbi:hypothetical protein B0A48_13698 [Cryoendolithus antarcticus]|uniref:Uncharacterized protein n=1 Tax=Cryoendolithus antarcticus TaxID=1507870 RepID=A0A1V8SN12_9PEZI|nr:hypothetical protein B0A48_13698 [Cryoendolithus antarcticus]